MTYVLVEVVRNIKSVAEPMNRNKLRGGSLKPPLEGRWHSVAVTEGCTHHSVSCADSSPRGEPLKNNMIELEQFRLELNEIKSNIDELRRSL